MTENNSSTRRCGYVAIVGRPNVGKSTLLNHILGQKISITSRKPQTTRHRVLGIKTEGDVQAIFVDTPGMHKSEPKAINRYMNRAATSAVVDVDCVLMLIEADKWTPQDDHVLAQLSAVKVPVILVVNKIDKLENKKALLPHLEQVGAKYPFHQLIPIAALQGRQLDALEAEIAQCLPESEHFYDEDQITDRSQRFLAAEIIREKIMRQLGQEVPYEMAVEIEKMERKGKVWHIHGLILVERAGQKNIVIGKQGQKLKTIGTEARLDIERMVDAKVMLNLWVKVKSGWSDDERALRSLGYDDRQ